MNEQPDIDVCAEVLAQAKEQGCWCADTRKRCQYHDGVEDGMLHMHDRLSDEIERLRAEVNFLMDGLEYGFGVIANAHAGDWTEASDEWQRAAARYRDEYWHPALDRNGYHRPPEEVTPNEQR